MDPSLIPALHDALTVARPGSVARAAERLHKTPSAVSQQLRRLGEALGAPLFERRGRGLGCPPWAAGAAGDHAPLRRGRRRLRPAGRPLRHRRLAAPDRRQRLPRRALLVPCCDVSPRAGAPLHFEITTAHSEEALRRLERGEVDLAIVSVAGERPELVSRTALRAAFPVGDAPARGAPAALDERLAREPVLRLAPGSGGRRLLDH